VSYIPANPFLDDQLWRRFKATCALMNIWPSDVLEELIERWLRQNEEKAQARAKQET
jgi:hypothetical protein